MSTSPLSQSQIDALLASLAPSASRPASANGNPWQLVGEEVAVGLQALLSRTWHRFVPDMTISRGAEVPVGTPASRVARLGTPLSMRLWLLWNMEGHEDVYDAVLNEVAALLPTPLSHQWLPGNIPLPEGAVVLPFMGQAPGHHVQLTLALEEGRLAALRKALGRGTDTPAAVPSGTGLGHPDLGRIEMDVTVYVGGGMYTLQELANLRPGSILTMATEIGEPAVLAINGRVIARGEVVVNPDNTFGVRVTKVHIAQEPDASERPVWLQRSTRA